MTRIPSWPDGRVPVLLSAHAEDLIAADARAIGRYLGGGTEVGVAEVAAQLLRTRRIRRYRTVVRAAGLTELTAGLDAVARAEAHPLVATATEASAPRVAFVVPGQGGQHPGMGADAYRALPGYRDAVDTCCAAFAAADRATPLRYLTEVDDPESFAEIEIQGAQFTHAVGLAAVWRHHGIVADLTVGHSLGEIAAAYLAGVIDLPAAIGVVAARAGVVDKLTGDYAVAALGITPAAARELIAETPGWLELSVINASSAVAVSGEAEAVTAAVARVRERGQLGREITVNFPVHTSVLEPLRNWVQAQLPKPDEGGRFAESPVQFIGGTTGAVVEPSTGFADYWYDNLRNTVRFDHAVQAAIDCGATVFIELSGHPALLHAVAERAADSAVLVGTGHRDAPAAEQFSANLAAVAVADPTHRWRELGADAPPASPLPHFPNAPMRATPLWAHREPLEPIAALTVAGETWRPLTEAPVRPAAAPRPAVLPLGPESALAAALRTSLADAGVTETDPAEAEVLVLVAPDAHDTDPVAAATTLTELAEAGGLRLADRIGPACREVWLVTAGAEQVDATDPVPAPVPAALAAAVRSIGLEHPEQSFGHVDVLGAEPPAAAAAVLDTVLAGPGTFALRWSAGAPRRYRRDLDLFGGSTVHAPDLPLDTGLLDDVVITGAAGAIGTHYARHLAERGARRIVMVSRRGADPALITELGQRYGTEIVSAACDLTDAAQLAAVAAALSGDGASLIVHAAGAATFGPATQLDGAAFAHTLAAKVTGLARLIEHWPRRADCRMLLCSSMSAVWGGQGHAAYSAANRMLDVLAAQERAAGRRCTAVRWGLWQAGADGIVDTAEITQIERSGLRQMAPDLAIAASLRDYTLDPMVLAADPDRLRMFLAGVTGAAAETPTATADSADLDGADTAQVVRTHLAAVLSAGPDDLDLSASLFDLGVDSLLALDLRKRLKRSLGHTVGLARLLSGITGTELVSDLDAASSTTR
ncbi:polyketide synthase [Mycolicibacterium chitae]|uniref:Acyl transferase domain-containing protein n=3 Tax=Mycolicibacterium chitae TaxID=1792 RepID=A0A3S4TLA6_MYCCI|nr:mycobactin polyketide synthase MbtD [Mycolicibacterium chitae]BBZ03721.1 polyketide synthase [Mycolicibacterium chitae]VEG47376.1 acyl transferase domain-containing protein [Mycolicibacterium chitae]